MLIEEDDDHSEGTDGYRGVAMATVSLATQRATGCWLGKRATAEMITVRAWISSTGGGYGDGVGGYHATSLDNGNGFGDSWEGDDGAGTGFGPMRGSRVVDNDVIEEDDDHHSEGTDGCRRG